MRFNPTPIYGAFVLEPERHEDDRGFFARTFCRRDFEEQGLNPCIVQCSTAFNRKRGTLRGFHWQIPPKAEAKLVRVTSGAIYDVIVDLRTGSPSQFQTFGVELSAANGRSIYIPETCGHAFQTLTDNTEVFYQMSEFFAPEFARGARWNDPKFNVSWPVPNPILNDRDRSWEDFQE